MPVISPMGNLPIVKDLVVDMEPFWAKFRSVDPYLQPGYNVPPAGREHVISPRRMAAIHKESLCINCGACVSECNAMESSPEFLGPQALAKAMRFVGDPRDGAKNEPAREAERRARDLGVHALLLLQRALPEGRRPARRDREARRRVDQGGDRPRHGREAREVVRHLGEDDRLAARDRARAEDAGDRRVDQADEVRARACAKTGKVPLPFPPHVAKDVREARRLHELVREQDMRGFAGIVQGERGAREARARPPRGARAIRTGQGSFPQPFLPGDDEGP